MGHEELQKLAAQFADMWQEQLSTLARDPKSTRGMAESLVSLQQQFLSMMLAPHARAPHTTAATSNTSHAFAELAARLEAVERKLAALESGAGKRRARPSRTAKKTSSPRRGKSAARGSKRKTR